ncbi:LemA family protein [Clostridium sp. OS1-26]|uniref:LemA family protein n=1 Tax=Clostridium sp. OS1-26 TaxID=3070681 RepID=UPI0027E1AEC9|nr:LemA family protein [Clostridium sp. OS1-26]WML34341.1 LemA family protein [Clostridium sp. OS1-26]
MKKIRERTYNGKIFSFIFGLIIGFFMVLCIFAIINSDKEISDVQGIISFILALISIIVYEILREYYYLKRLELTISSIYSNINIYKERESKLLLKVKNSHPNFSHHESDIQNTVASYGSQNDLNEIYNKNQISLNDLEDIIEILPNLNSNPHISNILNKIEELQNAILGSKLLYNEYVTYYNSAIISFPSMLFVGLWKLKTLQFYGDNE